MRSEGKVAVITGGGTGIGKHSALALLRDGYSVRWLAAEPSLWRRPERRRATMPLGCWWSLRTWGTPRQSKPSSRRPERPSAAWTCCSITQAVARRQHR